MLPGRLAQVPQSSFEKLAALLEGVTPEQYVVGGKPVFMTVGEPQDPPPGFVTDILAKHARDFGRYPPIAGTEEFRAAAAGWLKRRYALSTGAIDANAQILPLNGSREGLFYALFGLVPETKAGKRPVVLIPNPFYATYPAAVLASGAEAYYVPALRETGYLPDFARVPKDILARTVAAYYCSPSNPEGAVASDAQWTDVFRLADEYDFTVLADECYSDIYDAVPPPGAITARVKNSKTLDRLLGFHSLSKRSNLPGMRSGFMVGPAVLIKNLYTLRNMAGPQVPLPVIAASAAAWNDDAHVEETRQRYRERFAIAQEKLGNHPGFHLPEGGFYLWLNVGDGAKAAVELWRRWGVRVMPGAFMGVEQNPGKPGSNPGHEFIRIALVHDSLTIEAALKRVAETLRARPQF